VGTDTDGSSIQARHFTSSGLPDGPQFQVNSLTTGHRLGARVVALGLSAGFLVVWQSDFSDGTDSDPSSIQARRYSSDAMPQGAEFQVNVETTGYQDFPMVSSDGGGGFVVAWTSSDKAEPGYSTIAEVRARRLSSTGDSVPARRGDR
jgi:hypothetical protein